MNNQEHDKRHRKGQRAYQSGLSAETAVERNYINQGAELLATRWRGKSGEIDLIFRDPREDEYVFCEVKKAKTIHHAIERLATSQAHRIHGAASEYLENTPKGQLSNVRFDLALVDATGRVEIHKNAFGHF